MDLVEDALIGAGGAAGVTDYYYGVGGNTSGNTISWGLLAWSLYIIGLD